jgi:hypothetical protein
MMNQTLERAKVSGDSGKTVHFCQYSVSICRFNESIDVLFRRERELAEVRLRIMYL